MYFNIALKNVKKSFKDYTIYFLTLTLAVSIFYSFNSIESQKALIEISSSGKEVSEILIKVISNISIFVSFILGGLIVYANNFLVKKRKKELGIYVTLGMSKGRISNILVLETLIVAFFSLIVGIFLGIFTSQLLSLLAANLFEVSMSEYKFSISLVSIKKTIYNFGIMFLLVIIFNKFMISKYKIIDLLTSGRKNETVRIKNTSLYLSVFFISLIFIFSAYNIINKVGLDPNTPKFYLSILLGIIGTFLFFFSLSGFILFYVKNNKNIYLKKLNIFLVKQLNSKINTNFISISMICLMLFLTISILSSSLGFKNSVESSLKDATPFDASAIMYFYEDDKLKDIKTSLDRVGFKFGENDKYVFFNEYQDENTIADLIPNLKKYDKAKVNYVKLTDYNNILDLLGQEKVDLLNDEVLLLSNFDKLKKGVNEFLKDNNTIIINNNEYKIKNNKSIELNLITYSLKNNFLTVVMNDNLFDNKKVSSSAVNIQYSKSNFKESEKLYSTLKDYYSSENKNIDYDYTGFVLSDTRENIYAQTKGITNTIIFVSIYLGIIFLISSMAILAIQQLSEASDSVDRYISLKKIGASDKDIYKTIFTQTLVYFSLPIILAIIHSMVGIKVANDFISLYGKSSILNSSLMTSFLFIIIYLAYFIATYIGYKNIIKVKLK